MEPDKHEKNRDSTGRWIKGKSGNVLGRPKGKTMKEWARENLRKEFDEKLTQSRQKTKKVVD